MLNYEGRNFQMYYGEERKRLEKSQSPVGLELTTFW